MYISVQMNHMVKGEVDTIVYMDVTRTIRTVLCQYVARGVTHDRPRYAPF